MARERHSYFSISFKAFKDFFHVKLGKEIYLKLRFALKNATKTYLRLIRCVEGYF